MIALNEPVNTDPITDFVQTRTNEETQRNPGCATRPLLGGGRVLGHGLGAFGDGVLGQLAGEDESDTVWVSASAAHPCNGDTYEVWISRDEMVDFLL